MRRTKIVCTVGPASQDEGVLRQIIRSGMDVARLNFSHGDHPTHARNIALTRRLSSEEGRVVAVIQDLQGPRVRVGQIRDGQANLQANSTFTFTASQVPGDARTASVLGADLSKDVRPGDRILVDEGLIELRVEDVKSGDVTCRVINGGLLRPHKGINIPDVTLNIPTITDKDRIDLAFGAQQAVDFVALSFVRSGRDVIEARKLLMAHGSDAPIIAKVEKHEAVDNFDSILDAADGVMVARGDLGVEMPLEQVPAVQKMIIGKCRTAGKPVITATQMLNSMIENPRPTRAEVSDIANAIYDGTDAVMLSGETAVGSYPVESVATMDKIARETERVLPYTEYLRRVTELAAHDVTDAISQATVETAYELGAKAIVTMTTSGYTARMIAKHRPPTPILAATPAEKTRFRLALTWGVQSPLQKEYRTTDELIESAVDVAVSSGIAHEGDRIVITAGVPLGGTGRTNFLKVHAIGEATSYPDKAP